VPNNGQIDDAVTGELATGGFYVYNCKQWAAFGSKISVMRQL
jgi:hypothetical protein